MKWTLALVLFYLTQVDLSFGEIDLSNIEIPDIDDIDVIKERCDTKGGPGTYDKVKTAKENLETCLSGLFDFSKIKDEVEEAKKTGSMDEVFGKYCNKRPKVQTCVNEVIDAITPCLEESEKDALNITMDILKQLGEFVCYRDGDRIAMFVAEGGVECFQNHTKGIENCVNTTFQIQAPTTTNALPNIFIDKKKCDDLGKFQSCVVTELEKCKDSTPANIVDALFRFIKRSACTNRKTRSFHKLMRRSAETLSDLPNMAVLKNKLEEAIEKKCEKNGPEGSFAKIKKTLNETSSCLRAIQQQSIMVDSEQVKSKIDNCTKDLVEVTTECLPADEKNYPQFNLDVLYSFIDFMQNNKRKIVNAQFNREVMICFQNFRHPAAKKEIFDCVTPQDEDLTENNIFNIPYSCQRNNKIRDCLNKQIDSKCIMDKDLVALKKEFFEALNNPCVKYQKGTN